MEKYFVEFQSPGTFMTETSVESIDSWDVDKAVKMAHGIKERYGATPFGFRFLTRTRGPDDLDSSISEKSPMYYLGGEVRTLEQVQKDNKPDEHILRCNMEVNGFDRIITNKNSYSWTVPLSKEDVVLEFEVAA